MLSFYSIYMNQFSIKWLLISLIVIMIQNISFPKEEIVKDAYVGGQKSKHTLGRFMHYRTCLCTQNGKENEKD